MLKLKNNGLEEQTVKIVDFYLNHLAFNVNLEDPERVKDYKWEQNKPKIPSEETLNKIIASSGWKYSVVFTLLKDTGAMPEELSETGLRDIDFKERQHK